jgi:hypothetical protein
VIIIGTIDPIPGPGSGISGDIIAFKPYRVMTIIVMLCGKPAIYPITVIIVTTIGPNAPFIVYSGI